MANLGNLRQFGMAGGGVGKIGRGQIMEGQADKLDCLSFRWYMDKHFGMFLYFREKHILTLFKMWLKRSRFKENYYRDTLLYVIGT